MSKYLEKHTIKKGSSSEKVLTKLFWNKKWHQKLIDKGYNKAFKAVAKDAKTPVPSDTVLLVPIWSPDAYQQIKDKLKRNVKELEIAHGRSSVA